jgi:hypothetical protein
MKGLDEQKKVTVKVSFDKELFQDRLNKALSSIDKDMLNQKLITIEEVLEKYFSPISDFIKVK